MPPDPSTHATKVANTVLRAIGHDISRFYGIVQNSTPMEDEVVLSFATEASSKKLRVNNEFDRIKFVELGLFEPDFVFNFKRIFFYTNGGHSGRLALYVASDTSCIINLDAIVLQFDGVISSFMIGSDSIFFENKKDMMFARAIIMSHINHELVS